MVQMALKCPLKHYWGVDRKCDAEVTQLVKNALTKHKTTIHLLSEKGFDIAFHMWFRQESIMPLRIARNEDPIWNKLASMLDDWARHQPQQISSQQQQQTSKLEPSKAHALVQQFAKMKLS